MVVSGGMRDVISKWNTNSGMECYVGREEHALGANYKWILLPVLRIFVSLPIVPLLPACFQLPAHAFLSTSPPSLDELIFINSRRINSGDYYFLPDCVPRVTGLPGEY